MENIAEDKTLITIEAYDNNATSFADRFMDLKLYKKSFDLLLTKISDGDIVLDLGCGPGNVCKYLLSKNQTLSLHGIDMSKEMLKIARQNAPSAKFEELDIRKIECISEDSFDVVIAAFCLPFLYDNEAEMMIEKISRILKNHGRLYLSTMIGTGHRYEVPSFSKGDKFFFNYYTIEFIEKNISRNKFEIEEKIIQDYVNKDGTIIKDMIYILKKIGT
jgi:ubiquinone/menaquinone biosynthesis C-methylase UbiE